VVTATILALSSAVLHALWNLAVKQGGADRFLLLWGQFLLSALLSLPLVMALGMNAEAWRWIAVSGCVHLPYVVHLAKAYDNGDFSLVYPIARGGGAVLSAIGGVVLLGDSLPAASVVAIGVVAAGLFLLAGSWRTPSLRSAVIVACTIGVYSVSDAKGVRVSDTDGYVFATHIGTATSVSLWGIAHGRSRAFAGVVRVHWPRLLAAGTASTVTYAMVQKAFERAPVGYVTALRETSVVLAAFLGWRYFGERGGRRRLGAAVLVAAGLVGLVLTRL
jgi:drug/metabolite transporter (DMT)-like permease